MNPQSISIDLDINLAYQYSGLDELKTSIKKLHKKIRNANVDGYIVIGGGVTHLLNGLIATQESDFVYAQAPYYHKFPRYAELQKRHWAETDFETVIVTLPNNPDNSKKEPKPNTKGTVLYDLSYNWPTYGQVVEHNKDIMLFGLSKATGHASARIGWAIIKDKEVADKLNEWIEINSCGISYYSQLVAIKVIKNQIYEQDTVFKYGQEILSARWRTVLFHLDLPFERQSGGGMFMWCKGKCPDDIISIPGSEFGASDEYFRISLGVSDEVWEEFVERYAKQF